VRTIRVLQGTKGRTGGATSQSTSAITTSAGSVLAAAAITDTGTFSGTPIDDSKGNSWAQINTEITNFGTTGGSQRMRLYYSELAFFGASHTVTMHVSASAPCTLLVVEIADCLVPGVFDKTAQGNVHAVAPGPFATAATPLTAAQIELILGAYFGVSSANPATHAVSGATPPAGWTVHAGAEETDGTVFYTGCLASVRVTQSNAYVASFTELGNADAGIYVATFKENPELFAAARARRFARPRDGIGLQGSLDIKRWF
jgi:hypothetical protein